METLSVQDVRKMTIDQQFDLLVEMLDPYDWNYSSQVSVVDEIRVKIGLDAKYYNQQFPLKKNC